MWRNRFGKIAGIFFRTGGVYSLYAIFILSAFVMFRCAKGYISAIEADFEAPVEDAEISMNTEGNRVTFNYFLDFSPSMQGFLYEDINTDMKKLADAFEQINADNENNKFYWCRDNIELVETASDFYESLRSDSILNRYYGQILQNVTAVGNSEEEIIDGEETGNELSQAIDNIDLSDIFASNLMSASEEGTSDLNVIVTDLNFFRDFKDFERHNQWIDNFAQKLRTVAAGSNLCIYAVNSNYAGAGQDAYDGIRGNDTYAMFYVIVFSESESKYAEYCSHFENVMSLSNIQKFELRNHINGEAPTLDGNLTTFRALELGVTKENLNYAEGVFQNLDNDEYALQLVTAGTSSASFTAPVAEVNFSGYGVADTMGLDDSKIQVEVDLYQNKIQSLWKDSYEIYEDPSMILDKSAGMYYAANKWFLRVNLTFNTRLNVPEPDSWLKKELAGMKRNYIVMNLKFYMEKPSFSIPEWVTEVDYPLNTGEEIHGIGILIDSIIQYKGEIYATQPLNDRYLGNKVIYLLY